MSHQHEPIIYEIRLKESLREQWMEWFEGMTFTYDETGGTIIRGEIIDQAHLFGLLKKVRNLGVTLISATRIDSEDNQE